MNTAKSVNQAEISNFERIASEWWDGQGPFRPLHRINPHRLGYLRRTICAHYGKNAEQLHALAGLSVLDIGCGGGLICEPLARMGAKVSGIDAGPNNIEAAKTHAKAGGLAIDYRAIAAEEFVHTHGGQFDAVLALEILEHVNDPAEFVRLVLQFVRPGGIVVFSTLNRTLKSLALGKIAAEYVLRLVPAGTHDWRKFIRPSELARWVRDAGAAPSDTHGLVYDVRGVDFRLDPRDIDVNYFMTAIRKD